MLFHLSRYFVTEVLRVFLLTTAVLTTVIAFGAAIKPLAQDDLFSAGQIMRYVFAAMVPMLQYAIPVAAAFAVTLVIHRMASDNEIVAAAASGISYPRLLAPIAAFALVLVVVMSCFSHWITPKFLRLLERMITHDVTLLFQTAIQRDQAFQVGDLQIYADDLRLIDEPQGTDADTRMVLHRMAAVETDGEGRVKTDVTARQAVIDVFLREDQTYLKLLFVDLVGYKSPSGEVFTFPDLAPDKALAVPNAFRDSLDTRTTPQMHAILANPDVYGPIARMKDELVEALRDHDLAGTIRRQLDDAGELRFRAGTQSEYIVRAASFIFGELHGGDQPVELTELQNGRPIYRFLCERIGIARSTSALLEQPSLDLTLTKYRIIEVATGRENLREGQQIEGLELAGYAGEKAMTHTAAALLAHADALVRQGADDPTANQGVAMAADGLRWRLSELSADVGGRTAQRIALAFVVLLYAMAGMILSMLMRGSPPLMIYAIVFVPAILCMVLIFGGTEVMRDGNLVPGAIIMWSGHVMLLGMCLEGLRRLVRN
jgi:lipopolysaccharide export LptBFGC system permease protein LptF